MEIFGHMETFLMQVSKHGWIVCLTLASQNANEAITLHLSTNLLTSNTKIQ